MDQIARMLTVKMVDTNLTLRNQIQSPKKKAIFNLLNIVRIAKFINKDSRMKLVHNLVFSHLGFGNPLYYNLPNRDLHGIQIIINNASRVIMGMPRYSKDRITTINISFHFLPVRATHNTQSCCPPDACISSGTACSSRVPAVSQKF